MTEEPQFTLVTPEVRGQIQIMANSGPMKALLRSMELRSQLIQRQVARTAIEENYHAIIQKGAAGISDRFSGELREAAALTWAVELIRREISEPQIQKLL